MYGRLELSLGISLEVPSIAITLELGRQYGVGIIDNRAELRSVMEVGYQRDNHLAVRLVTFLYNISNIHLQIEARLKTARIGRWSKDVVGRELAKENGCLGISQDLSTKNGLGNELLKERGRIGTQSSGVLVVKLLNVTAGMSERR